MSADPELRSVEEPMPVSGRSEPRPKPLPSAFRHDLRLHGLPSGEIRAVCTCTEGTGDQERQWARTYEGGHTPHDFVRLEMQHITGKHA